MKAVPWLLFGGCLVSIGAMGASLNTWAEALRPAFVFGVLGVVGTQIGLLFTDKIGGTK